MMTVQVHGGEAYIYALGGHIIFSEIFDILTFQGS
jgi:hypothetical protein